MDPIRLDRVQVAHIVEDSNGVAESSVAVHFASKKFVRECARKADRITIENVAVPAKFRKFGPMIALLAENEDSFNQFLENVATAGFRLGQRHEACQRRRTRKR